MPQTLTAENPTIYPATIDVPADSDSPLASGQLKTTLKMLADRSDDVQRRLLVASLRHLADIQTQGQIGDGVIGSGYSGDTWADIALSTITFVGAKAGDIVIAFANIVVACTTSDWSRVAIAYTENGGSAVQDYRGSIRQKEAAEKQHNILFHHLVAVDGNFVVKLQRMSDTAGDTINVYGPAQLTALILRNET